MKQSLETIGLKLADLDRCTDELAKELRKRKPDKSTLRHTWDDIKRISRGINSFMIRTERKGLSLNVKHTGAPKKTRRNN